MNHAYIVVTLDKISLKIKDVSIYSEDSGSLTTPVNTVERFNLCPPFEGQSFQEAVARAWDYLLNPNCVYQWAVPFAVRHELMTMKITPPTGTIAANLAMKIMEWAKNNSELLNSLQGVQ